MCLLRQWIRKESLSKPLSVQAQARYKAGWTRVGPVCQAAVLAVCRAVYLEVLAGRVELGGLRVCRGRVTLVLAIPMLVVLATEGTLDVNRWALMRTTVPGLVVQRAGPQWVRAVAVAVAVALAVAVAAALVLVVPSAGHLSTLRMTTPECSRQ